MHPHGHGHGHPIHVSEESTHLVPVDGDGRVFHQLKITYVDDEGLTRTTSHSTRHVAGCGHIVGNDPRELISVCTECGSTLCIRCGDNRCLRCLDILCSTHTHIFRGAGYCLRCRRIEIAKWLSWMSLKGLGLTIKWSGYAAFFIVKWTFIGLFRFLAWSARSGPRPPPGSPMVMR